jgi:hypothetical protein
MPEGEKFRRLYIRLCEWLASETGRLILARDCIGRDRRRRTARLTYPSDLAYHL